MGLAASQARFLAITSRKMNCEFQSMEIAQQKLSVTRDMQRAAKDYQNSLDATKLIWESDDGFIYDLSFATMMTPSNLNSYNCNIVTDQQGRAVLSKEMFAAALDAGIIKANGDPVGSQKSNPAYDYNKNPIIDSAGNEIDSYGADDNFTTYQYAAFLNELGKRGQAPATIVDDVKDIYNSKIGVGGTLPDNTMATALTTGAFLNYLSHPATVTVQSLPANSSLDFNIFNSNGNEVYTAGTVNGDSSINYYILSLKAGDKLPQTIKYDIPEGTMNSTGKNITYGAGKVWENNTAAPADCNATLAKGEKAPCDIRIAIQTPKTEGSTIKLTDVTNPFPAFGNLTDETSSGSGITNLGQLYKDYFTGDAADDYVGYDTSTSLGQHAGTYAVSNGTSIISESKLEDLTLADLLEGNYLLTLDFGALDEKKEQDCIHGIIEKLINTIAETLGYKDTVTGTGLNVDEMARQALKAAIDFTKIQFNEYEEFGNGQLSDGKASKYNVVCHDGDETYSLSVSNIAKSFLTYFANNLGGFDTGFVINDKVADSIYSLDDLNYYYMIANDAQSNDTEYLNAGFYNQLYNYICMYGACTDTNKQELVMDNAYLSNALKNGQLFIASLNSDGYFYQGHYTDNGYVAEVSDEDAIAKAEIEYEMTKTKLDYKEQTLELKMKNLDTEISALSSELDTVKSLIGKNVEKVFTMFST